jgi:hypothetical protein
MGYHEDWPRCSIEGQEIWGQSPLKRLKNWGEKNTQWQTLRE